MLAKKVSLQLPSEQSVGDVWIAQLEWKRVPQARSSGCRSSVGRNCWVFVAKAKVTRLCTQHIAS